MISQIQVDQSFLSHLRKIQLTQNPTYVIIFQRKKKLHSGLKFDFLTLTIVSYNLHDMNPH